MHRSTTLSGHSQEFATDVVFGSITAASFCGRFLLDFSLFRYLQRVVNFNT